MHCNLVELPYSYVMSIEIERKFLVRDLRFKQEAYQVLKITQGYLNSLPERNVRIRVLDEKAILTIKGPSSEDGTTRFEWEKEIPVAEARLLMQLCEPGLIDKERYLINTGNHTIEVDVFHGDNEGLILAEIELHTSDEEIVKPSWLGKEVTGDNRYYNSSLISQPYSTW